MTRRQFLTLLTGALNEQSREIARTLYARPRQRGERNRAKLATQAPTVAPKSAKVRRK